MKAFKKLNKTQLTIAGSIALLVIVSGIVWFTARAAGFFTAVESDTGTLTANAKVVADSSASGGKAIQFTAPAPAPDPDPTPPSGGGTCTTKPDATNTGTSGTLTADGRTVLNTANEVVQNKSFPAGIEIRADGVQLKNVSVGGHILINEADNTVLDHVEAVGVSISSASNITIQYVHISAFEDDSFHITSDGSSYINNVRIQYSYVDRPGFNPGSLSHWDGVQVRGADNLAIFCNNFDVGAWQDPYNVLVYFEQANGGNDHLVVDHNWLNGGNFAIMSSLPDVPVNLSITNNKLRSADFHFGYCYLGGGWNATYLSHVIQTGNTLDGAPMAQVCKESDL